MDVVLEIVNSAFCSLLCIGIMEITFRTALPDDAGVIADFNLQLAAETEGRLLDSDLVHQGVENAMRLGPEAQYYVAEVDGTVVGQLMLTREWSDWRNGWIAWLQSVYVLAEFRGQGVFRQLFNYVKKRVAEGNDAVAIRLYVERENGPAINTYEKLGFEDPGYRVMELPL